MHNNNINYKFHNKKVIILVILIDTDMSFLRPALIILAPRGIHSFSFLNEKCGFRSSCSFQEICNAS